MDKISAILKKRIKEMGYSQERFAYECGISLATLKVYLNENSKISYNVEMLKRFSQKLDCSYDYLLGKSETPYPEIQTLKEELCLSDKALAVMKCSANIYKGEKGKIDGDTEAVVQDLVTTSLVLENTDLINTIRQYLYFNENDTHFSVLNDNEHLTFQSRVEIGGVFFSPEDINESAMVSKVTALLTEMKKEFLSYKDKNKILERGITEECQETLKGMAP